MMTSVSLMMRHDCVGHIRNATSAKAERVLEWTPRSREDAIVATAESLLKFGIVGS